MRMRQQRCAAMLCLFHVYPTPVYVNVYVGCCMLNIEMCSLYFISKLISCFYLYLRFIHFTFTFLFYSQTLQRIKIENPLYDQSKAVKCISFYMYHSYTLCEILSRKRGFNKERCAQYEGRIVTYHSRVFCHTCRQ